MAAVRCICHVFVVPAVAVAATTVSPNVQVHVLLSHCSTITVTTQLNIHHTRSTQKSLMFMVQVPYEDLHEDWRSPNILVYGITKITRIQDEQPAGDAG